MITSAQAYASGPDGVVDTSEGSPFAQYMAQQNANFANVGPGSALANSLSGGQNYLANNADVLANAQMRAQAEGLTSGDAYSNRLNEIAREHYNAFGQTEGRAGFGNPGAPPPDFSSGGGPGGGTGGNMGGGPGGGTGNAFDNSGYETALNNFGGLLNNYGDFFGGLLSGAQNAQETQPMNQGQNYTGFYGPQQASNGFGGGFNNFGNFGGLSGGFSNGSTWGGGSGSSSGGNTGHRQLWTT